MHTCIICSNERIVNCFGIRCCKECKIAIASRPPNFELFSYLDGFYGAGEAHTVHIKLFRFWYDREGRPAEQARCDDKYKRGASLASLCCDVICRDPELVLSMHHAVPSCSPQWTGVLKAWCRWKRKRGRKPTKNAHARVLLYHGWTVGGGAGAG